MRITRNEEIEHKGRKTEERRCQSMSRYFYDVV